jgi:hypothetical protein
MIKKVIILAVIILAIYTGIQFGTPYYHYYIFKSDMEELSTVPLHMKELRERIMTIANDYNIPVDPNNVVITGDRPYNILISWDETVNMFDYYKKTFYFSVDTSY